MRRKPKPHNLSRKYITKQNHVQVYSFTFLVFTQCHSNAFAHHYLTSILVNMENKHVYLLLTKRVMFAPFEFELIFYQLG